MAYVSLSLKGEKIGTSTDLNGYYSLNNLKKGNYTLVASMIGYKTQEKKL